MTSLLKYPYELLRPLYEKTSFHKSVIEDISDAELKEAYQKCREITRTYAKTFYMATRFLPNEKQRGVFAIYGLCRYLDNLVDESEDLILEKKISFEDIDIKLNQFRKDLSDAFYGKSIIPIFIAFGDTLRKYNISLELPFLLMEGVRQDLNKDRYENFQEVHDYSYKVASVVGLMTSQVFGYEDESALSYAVDLGIAMQLTNILRDIGEDLKRNRIYLPKEDLEKFGVTEESMFAQEKDENFINMMKFQIQRTREYYDKADIGIKMLDKDSRLPVYLARHNYSRILDKIEESNYNVFKERAFLNQSEKLFILPKILMDMRNPS